MNIPLNIDWQQILLHLFNFGILAGGLWLLLYKPVKKFMDQRTQRYADMDAEAEKKLSEAEALRQSFDAKLSEADSEIRQREAASAEAADAAARRTLEEARQQADQLLAASRAQAEAERSRMIGEAENEIVQLASDAVRKLVLEQDAAYDAFSAAFDGDDHE